MKTAIQSQNQVIQLRIRLMKNNRIQKLLLYVVILFLFIVIEAFLVDPPKKKYTILERDSGNDSLLILAKIVKNDTLIIDTFYHSFDYSTEFSYCICENENIFLYAESLINYDPNANAEIGLNLIHYKISENNVTEVSNEYGVVYKKNGHNNKGIIKDFKFYMICSSIKDSTANWIKCDSIININMNNIMRYYDYCK